MAKINNEKCPFGECAGYCKIFHVPGSKKRKHMCCLSKYHVWETW